MNSSKVAAQGPPGGLAVNIVNPLPVPVSGSTTVSGSVAATQSGTWNVGVTNPATNPVLGRDVDNPARQPFQAGLSTSTCNEHFPTSVAVPVGKRLVIEQLAGECFGGITLGVGLTVTVNSTAVTHLFGVQYPLPNSASTAYTNHTTRLYGDGGTNIVIASNCLPGSFVCDLAFSGYLITP